MTELKLCTRCLDIVPELCAEPENCSWGNNDLLSDKQAERAEGFLEHLAKESRALPDEAKLWKDECCDRTDVALQVINKAIYLLNRFKIPEDTVRSKEHWKRIHSEWLELAHLFKEGVEDDTGLLSDLALPDERRVTHLRHTLEQIKQHAITATVCIPENIYSMVDAALEVDDQLKDTEQEMSGES